MKNTKWWLYIGLFMCCTGIGIVPGVLMVALWAYLDYTNKKDMALRKEQFDKNEYAEATLKEGV